MARTAKVKPPIVAMTPADMLARFGAYPYTVLGIDASSSVIGYCVLTFNNRLNPAFDNQTEPTYSICLASLKLSSKQPIQRRCAEGYKLARELGARYGKPPIGAIGIEDAVAKYANAIMQQSRVVGAMLAAFDQLGYQCETFAPKAGKKILSGSGVAGPDQMITAAREFTSQPVDEHSAHALGIALARLDLEYPATAPAADRAAGQFYLMGDGKQ